MLTKCQLFPVTANTCHITESKPHLLMWVLIYLLIIGEFMVGDYHKVSEHKHPFLWKLTVANCVMLSQIINLKYKITIHKTSISYPLFVRERLSVQ